MNPYFKYTCITLMLLSMMSCAVVGGIFKAGMVWGILLVVGVIALVIYLLTRGKK